MNIREGVAGAHYHRDRVADIERQIVARVREEFPPGSRPDFSSASIRVSTIAHEYIAYLNAVRRSLEYVARAVAGCFGLQGGSIKSLAKAVKGSGSGDLADRVASACAGLHGRFAYVLSRDNGSHRATAPPIASQ